MKKISITSVTSRLAARGQQGDVDSRVERGADGRDRVAVEVNSTKT